MNAHPPFNRVCFFLFFYFTDTILFSPEHLWSHRYLFSFTPLNTNDIIILKPVRLKPSVSLPQGKFFTHPVNDSSGKKRLDRRRKRNYSNTTPNLTCLSSKGYPVAPFTQKICSLGSVPMTVRFFRTYPSFPPHPTHQNKLTIWYN